MKTDLKIQQDVMDELQWEPLISSTEIGIVVKNGIVSLTGTVDSYAKKISAEKAAMRVEGVKAVAEEIEVKLSNGGWRDDVEIAEAILHTLKWQTSVDENRIKIKIENGWVTLEGNLDWEFERKQVTNVIENLLGVRGITCRIKIVPLIALKEVKHRISAALHRNVAIDASEIHVDTEDSTVILTGKVSSLSEKEDAGDAAWSAPGVTKVKNELIVTG